MFDKFFINKKLLKELDYGMIGIAIAIMIFSALNIYSATHMEWGTFFLKKQLIWLVGGLVIIYIILIFDYIIIENYAEIFYWFTIFLLILNDTVLKKTVNGASSWMEIGPISIQPSEFAKIALIIILAKKLDDMEGEINNLRNFLTLAFYVVIPMILLVVQPDMGMIMVFFFTVLGMFFVAGLDGKIISGGIAGLTALVAIIWNSPLMQAYWKSRLTSFLHPEADELNAGHQLIQSKIGIGSGGFLGKGFLKGTQISGGYIPEAHTDFIFSVVGEEWGFIGATVLLVLYGILIYKFIKTAKNSKDIFGSMVTIGVTASFMFSILQNIGMTIGLVPITGITLPFMSYGGSSSLNNFFALALVLNINMRRKKINF
ncbi:TPA: rod shape-determining protein RodA [Clostridium botulinum]|uniref:Peptidoglycan glycosyltransferase RodA n=1 Tax=Clostridium botulinum B str. Osaka05 TaxID=1407017 RepID=A0A0S6U8H6_CLOBO|nr:MULTISPECIES: rod shape-determining protein RodA [Clostridium]AUM96771.1 rod shape-determining protein RodA [Clostridium sporogenes]AVQ54222.1 rod shape-determining protein RodA [Clostridium botulinum]EJE7233569.1 rod shape-determining protein RodA [Clostridium botulinum]MBO0524383.1 rod shape-determining protein RodA [Clostridium botulinum]MBO0531574.1 rod shape-determining protein RodA [Clostridium botulinum]